MSTTIKGFDALKKKLDQLSKQGARRAMGKATRAGTKILLDAVKTTVPREEGLLAKMQTSKIVGKGQGMRGIVGADVAKLTAAQEAEGDAHRPSNLDHLVEEGHVTPDGRMVPPNGYLRRAADSSMSAAQTAFIDRLATEIESRGITMIDVALTTLFKQWTTPTLAGRVSLSTAADKVTVDLPKLKFTPLAGPIPHTDSGPMTLVKGRVQLDLFTTSVVDGRAILKTIRDAAHAYAGGTVDGTPIVRLYFDELPTVASAGLTADQSNVTVARLTCDLLVDYRD